MGDTRSSDYGSYKTCIRTSRDIWSCQKSGLSSSVTARILTGGNSSHIDKMVSQAGGIPKPCKGL